MRGCSALKKITLHGFFRNLGGGVCFSCAQPKGHYKHFKKKFSAFFAGLAVCSAFNMAMPHAQTAPRELINIKSLSKNIHVNMAYVGKQNFLGQKLKNYEANSCYLKEEAAAALVEANENLKTQGYQLSFRDCWRPLSTSFYMSQWADEQDQKNLKIEDLNPIQQEIFEDPRLFDSLGFLRTSRLKQLGYLATYSNHNKGSTVDIELLQWTNERWNLADTGTVFDIFSQRAAFRAEVGTLAKTNRKILANALHQAGFRGLSTEWWHWTHTASNKGPYLDGTVN